MTRHLRFACSLAFALAALSACTVSHQGRSDAGDDARMVVPIPDAYVGPDTHSCAVGLVDCNGTCSRVAADSMNCGSCGNVCATGTSCAVGRCDCLAPKISCDGLCIDLQRDAEHCGTCDHGCASTDICSMGECVVMCTEADHRICVNTDASGTRTQVCADLMNDPMNCGTCNTRCAGGATCTAGICACPTGQEACSGTCVDLLTDSNNCSFCLTSCGVGGVCVGGSCTTCGGSLTSCGSPAHCYDTQTSTLHCGACGNACPAGAGCSGGACACPGGATACGSVCADLMTNPSNCGSCGHRCQAMSMCTAGACECSTGLNDCGGVCVDLTTDLTNCGACGTNCGPGGACVAGACTCAAGYDMCDGLSCTNTQTDRLNCGTCGNVCPGAYVCLMGGCTNAPPTRYRETTPTAVQAPWIDACAAPGHTTLLPNVDDSSAPTTLPFPFRYWATNLLAGATINISSNGFISMDGVANASLGGSIPSIATPNATIAAHWGDLHTGPTGVCIATVGAPPNRQWVAEWGGTYNYPSGGMLNFEIVLSENNGFIDIIFDVMSGAASRVTGVEDQTGAMAVGGCTGGTATTCMPTTGMRARFEPIP